MSTEIFSLPLAARCLVFRVRASARYGHNRVQSVLGTPVARAPPRRHSLWEHNNIDLRQVYAPAENAAEADAARRRSSSSRRRSSRITPGEPSWFMGYVEGHAWPVSKSMKCNASVPPSSVSGQAESILGGCLVGCYADMGSLLLALYDLSVRCTIMASVVTTTSDGTYPNASSTQDVSFLNFTSNRCCDRSLQKQGWRQSLFDRKRMYSVSALCDAYYFDGNPLPFAPPALSYIAPSHFTESFKTCLSPARMEYRVSGSQSYLKKRHTIACTDGGCLLPGTAGHFLRF